MSTAGIALRARATPGRERALDALQRYGVWFALAALVLYAVVAVDTFATGNNLENVLRQMAPLGIVAVAQTLVIVSGGVDLSVGMLMGLVVVLTNGLMEGDPANIPLAVVVALAIGVGVGLTNGLLVVLTKVDSLIITLGMLSILQGGIFLYTDRTIGEAPREFRELSLGMVGPVPTPFLVLIGVALLAALVLDSTPLGRWTRAVGGNELNARRSGVPVSRVRLAVFVLSGVGAAIAGLVLAARLGSGYTGAGIGFELRSVVAAVLGGAVLGGARGSIAGTLGGVALLTVLANVLNLSQVTPFVQEVVEGSVIVVAVALYSAGRWSQR